MGEAGQPIQKSQQDCGKRLTRLDFWGTLEGAARWRSQGLARVAPSPASPTVKPSLEGHVQTLGDVGAEAGGDDDAAAHLLRGDVSSPDRVAAGPKNELVFGGSVSVASKS